jgi:hypothetical protein
MNWNAIVDKVAPYVVKIETPSGHGTGFLCLYNHDKSFLGIATARHVIENADEWQQPLRIRHFPTQTTQFFKESDRTILSDPDTDSAVILISSSGDLKLPEDTIPLLPTSIPLDIGTDVGWLGYPSMAPYTLCFFSGSISARQEWRHAYLIDGVAINGVSGGPVLHLTDTAGVHIVGTVSAYVGNKVTGATLPGLAIARDVSHFHDMISMIKSLDEAREKKQEQQASSAQPPQEGSVPDSTEPNTEPPLPGNVNLS